MESTQSGKYFEIIPDRDGQLMTVYPPIITKGYYNYYSSATITTDIRRRYSSTGDSDSPQSQNSGAL